MTHREWMEGFYLWRETEWARQEEETCGYDTETREYREHNEPVTLKRYMILTTGR